MTRLGCIVLLFSFIGFAARAQEFPTTRLGVEEGLGHSIAYRTFQSKNGYLWFSTDNGLTRFDGINFKNFTAEDGLGSNFIFDIKEVDSTLIISAFGSGLISYQNRTFKPFISDSSSVRYPISLEFFRNQLWVIDRYKQLHYLKDGRSFPVTAGQMGISDDDYVETYNVCATDTAIFIATSSGLFAYNGKTYTRYNDKELSKVNIYNVRMLRNGNLLVGTHNHLMEFDLRTHTFDTLFTSEHFSPSTCLLEDHEGNIWMSLINGDTYLLKPSSAGTPREAIRIIHGVVVNQLFEDRERNMWLSTYGEGAWCIRSIHVRNYPIRGGILSDLTIGPPNENLTVSTLNAGLKFFHQTQSGYLVPTVDEALNSRFRNKKNIVTILNINENFKCFSSDDFFYTWRNNRLDSLKIPALISVLYHQKSKNRVWIGCRFGLAYYEPGKPLTVRNDFNSRVIKSITEDSHGNILLGTDNGVFVEGKDTFTPIPTEKTEKPAYINALYTDSASGITWVGTNSGLAKIENGKLEFTDYPLTKIRCNSITSDRKGRLWIGTVKGLLHFDGHRYQLVTTKEGIAQSNVNRVMYQQENDILTLLTSNAISVLDAQNFLEGATFELPNIIIEQISSGSRSIPYSSSIFELGKDHRDLKVVISTPIIKNRDKLMFSYRLNDEQWTEFNGRELSLKALPYGNLKLTIRVQEQYMSASEKAVTLSLLIPKPYFVRWWFLMLMLIVLTATIALLVFSYSRQKNRKLLEENKRLDIEHKALKNLLNPHFLYNAINSIHAFILQNDQRKTLAYLAKFSQLVRLNLELLSADRVTLDKEIKNISLYLEFEKLRFADKLNYSIEIDPDIVQPEIEIPSFLIQPFLENAIWHGLLPRAEGGNLRLRVDRRKDQLVITVDDDGVGINTSLKSPKADLEKKTSMGINIIRERIELLRKFNNDFGLVITDKTDLNGKATSTGTVVRITVPLEE
jgi:ligand-binding sensor domain-containing protein